MHLVCDTAQRVKIPSAGLVLDLAPSESIWTESSYKYETAGVGRLGAAAGLSVAAQWIDAVDRFALTLFTR
jgi:uncharacterized SAM-dependent methyltransferase